jgi:hypothetical protein
MSNRLTRRAPLPIAVLATVLMMSPAKAQHEKTPTLMGQGALPCSTWVTYRRGPDTTDRRVLETWIAGFLSGVAVTGSPEFDPLNGMNADAVWGWIDDYCQTHQLKSLANAAVAFVYAHPH